MSETAASDSSSWIVFLGVAIGIFSAVASNIGTNTQKYGFMAESTKAVQMRRPYQQQPLWWLGFILVVLGALGDLLSFSLAPQSLVAPTGSFTLVSNVFFARVWLGEILTTRDIVGTVLVIAGAVISVSFGSHEETAYSIEELQALYLQPSMAVYGVFIILLWAGLVTIIRRSEAILRDSMAGVAALQEASPIAVQCSPSDEVAVLPIHTGKEVDADVSYAAMDIDTPGPAAATAAAASTTTATSFADAASKAYEEEGGLTHKEDVSTTTATSFADAASKAYEEEEGLTHKEDVSTTTGAPVEASPSSPQSSETASKKQSDEMRAASKQAVELAQLTAGLREPPEAYTAYARWHPLAYAAMAGSIGGQTVMFAKSLGEIVKATAGGTNQFIYFFTYVILVCMVACTVFEQHFLASSLQLFDALLVVPVFSSAFMLITVLGGAAYFGELASFTTVSWVLFPTGILLTVIGVLILSLRKQTGDGMRQLEEVGDITPITIDEMEDDPLEDIGGRGIELVSVAEVDEEDEDEDEEGGVSPTDKVAGDHPLTIQADDAIEDVIAAAKALAVPRVAAEDGGDASPSAVEVEAGRAGPMMGDHHEQGKHAAIMQGTRLVSNDTDEEIEQSEPPHPPPTGKTTTPRAKSAAAIVSSRTDGIVDPDTKPGSSSSPHLGPSSPASPPTRPIQRLSLTTPSPARSGASDIGGIAGGSGGSRRGSLLRPDWQTVVASRPTGLASLLPFATGTAHRHASVLVTHGSAEHEASGRGIGAASGGSFPVTPERVAANRRPRASTDIPTSYGSAPDLLGRGSGGAGATGAGTSLTPPSRTRAGAAEPEFSPRPTARRPSLLDSTLSLINAVTVSHTVVSAFGTGSARPRAATARSPRIAQIHRASSAHSRTGTPHTASAMASPDALPRSRSEASPPPQTQAPMADAAAEASSPPDDG